MLLAHCAGDVGAPAVAGNSGPNGTSDPIGRGETQRLCAESKDPPAAPLRRLTKKQYRNALHELLTSVMPLHGEGVWREVEPSLQELPDDVRDKKKPFASMDGALSAQHVRIYMQIGEKVARAITDQPDRLRAFMDCRLGEPAKSCIDGFIQRFATKVYRHKPTAEETELLHKAYADDRVDPAAVADVITLGLNAPQFLYQLEFGDKPVDDKPGTYALTDVELANRIALTFWQRPADERLMKAAESGQLRTDEGYQAVLKWVLDDRKAQDGLADFVTQWLDLEQLPQLDARLPHARYRAFAGADAPSRGLREAMIDEVVDSFRYHFNRGDDYREWFLSPYSFARSDELARLYQTPVWRGIGTPPQFPPNTRSGLITRAALLASGSENTRPILKGVRIRERILCDDLPPPDPTAVNATDLSKSSDIQTTRQAVEKLTEPAQCASCHATKINGLGFATENYDALGRMRTQQTLFSEAGEVLARRPIDTKSVPRVDGPDDGRVSSGANDLALALAGSPKTEACFARQYVRYAFGRRDDADECMVGSLHYRLEDGQSLRDTIMALAMRPEFRTKVIDTP